MYIYVKKINLFSKMVNWFNCERENSGENHFLEYLNSAYIEFFNTYVWIIYLMSSIAIAIGIVYFLKDLQLKRNIERQRREIRRAQNRNPQKRRRNTAFRDHEIYQTLMRKVRKYIHSAGLSNAVLRQSESGTILVEFVDGNGNHENNITSQEN